jgi:hypothetical protein
MSSKRNDSHIAHTSTVRQIIESQQATWKAILNLQATDDMNPDGVFVESNRFGSLHPQKKAHTYLLGYHNLMANKTYWAKAKDVWQEELKLENGDEYEIEVPENDTLSLNGSDLTLDNVDTDTETITLETLSHNWAFRYVTVERAVSDSFQEEQLQNERKRVWLSPRGIQLAFEQLEEVRSKIGIAAEIETPGWRSDEPLSLTEEEWKEHLNNGE